MHTVYVGIGSNLGDRKKNCHKAIELLVKGNIATSLEKSRWYETEPLLAPKRCQAPFRDAGRQENYINGVARFKTGLSPVGLLHALQDIEAGLGRIRNGEKWGPRTIDLDILFYDDLVIETAELTVPHPELHKRKFVLRPLCDIAPDLRHPVMKRTARQLLEAL